MSNTINLTQDRFSKNLARITDLNQVALELLEQLQRFSVFGSDSTGVLVGNLRYIWDSLGSIKEKMVPSASIHQLRYAIKKLLALGLLRRERKCNLINHVNKYDRTYAYAVDQERLEEIYHQGIYDYSLSDYNSQIEPKPLHHRSAKIEPSIYKESIRSSLRSSLERESFDLNVQENKESRDELIAFKKEPTSFVVNDEEDNQILDIPFGESTQIDQKVNSLASLNAFSGASERSAAAIESMNRRSDVETKKTPSDCTQDSLREQEVLFENGNKTHLQEALSTEDFTDEPNSTTHLPQKIDGFKNLAGGLTNLGHIRIVSEEEIEAEDAKIERLKREYDEGTREEIDSSTVTRQSTEQLRPKAPKPILKKNLKINSHNKHAAQVDLAMVNWCDENGIVITYKLVECLKEASFDQIVEAKTHLEQNGGKVERGNKRTSFFCALLTCLFKNVGKSPEPQRVNQPLGPVDYEAANRRAWEQRKSLIESQEDIDYKRELARVRILKRQGLTNIDTFLPQDVLDNL